MSVVETMCTSSLQENTMMYTDNFQLSILKIISVFFQNIRCNYFLFYFVFFLLILYLCKTILDKCWNLDNDMIF